MESKEMDQWAKSEKLTPETLRILREDGFDSLEGLALLSSADINDFFTSTNRLSKEQCLRLRKAVEKLSLQTSQELAIGSEHISNDEKMDQWAQREKLTPETLSQLRADGFDCLEDIALLTSADINQYASQHSLTKAQCLRLEKAVRGLTMEAGEATAMGRQDCNSHQLQAGISPESQGIRLLLVGKTGVGKSTTGNTILGEDKFQTSVRFSSETSECEIHQALVCGLKVEITYSPGLFDAEERDNAFAEKVVQTVALMFPGAHAFLYIIKIGRFTKEEEAAYLRLKAIFDEHVTKYMVVVFTGGDNLIANGKTIDDIITTAPNALKDILKACGGRYVVFDNTAADKQPQVRRLLNSVRSILEENDYQCYTCSKYMSVRDKMEEEIQKRMMAVEEREIQNKRYIKELETKSKLLEDMAKMGQDYFDKREEDRKKQFLDLQEKIEKRMQVLLEKAEQSSLGANEVEKRMKILQKEKEDLQNDFKEKQIEARRVMEEEAKKRKKRSDTFVKEIRKAREANQKAYEEEMKKIKRQYCAKQTKSFIW